MRNSIILAVALLASTASGDEPDLSEVQQAFFDLFPASPAACPDNVPENCTCGEFDNLTELPMRYTRVQGCPHPVLEDVYNLKTFTADGAVIDDAMIKNGRLHGATISWHPNGTVEGIASFDEGQQIGFARVWHDNGALLAEQRFVDGQPHGTEFGYSAIGELEWIIVWEHGNIDREETRRLSRSLGIEAPFDRARPAASPEDDKPFD